MSKINRKVLTQAMMRHVAKVYLGFCGGQNVSLYSVIAKVLESTGLEKPAKYNDKQFVLANQPSVARMFHESTRDAAKPVAPKTAATTIYDEANSDAFLGSYRWRQLRMVAIKTHGARCQCCGASAATGAVINVDHIKPRRKFPELALVLDNLQVLCDACNHGKGNWDETDWRPTA